MIYDLSSTYKQGKSHQNFFKIVINMQSFLQIIYHSITTEGLYLLIFNRYR